MFLPDQGSLHGQLSKLANDPNELSFFGWPCYGCFILQKEAFSLITFKMFEHKNLVEKILLTSLASLLLTSTAFYSVGNQFVADIIVRQK